ncbi:MAG TPA: hypothetical protein VJ547_11990 [Candidatus Thermoplasmatota archaeon]|nr:hypothetical protein [Candidatus Thermoplasmatota archaeon]
MSGQNPTSAPAVEVCLFEEKFVVCWRKPCARKDCLKFVHMMPGQKVIGLDLCVDCLVDLASAGSL